MKLRLRGNSIRLRLTKSDIEELDKTGLIEDVVEFGPEQGVFRYELLAGSDVEARCRFGGNRLTVSIPSEEARDWTNSDQVGLEYLQSIGDDKNLRILIEKDFACLAERPNEDDSDAFPNPLSGPKC